MKLKLYKALCIALCISFLLSLFTACDSKANQLENENAITTEQSSPTDDHAATEATPEPTPDQTVIPSSEVTQEVIPSAEPTPGTSQEPVCEPEPISDKTIYALRGNGYLNKSSFTDREQAAVQSMLDNIEYMQKENFEYAWNKMLFAVKQGDTWIHFWPDNRVDHQKDGHGVVGYNCSNIDYSVLIEILSEPDDSQMEISRTQEDIDSALAEFREFFSQFEQQGCVIDRLWYEEYASAYYTLAFFGQHPEQMESEKIISLFLEYSAGEIGFYTAPENEPLVIYMMREESGAQWEFESWLEGAVTQE